MILHLDCPMGLAGDMLLGALLALHPHREDALARLNGLGLPGIGYSVEKRPQGLHAVVAVYGAEEGHEHQDAHHHHHHHTIADICHILDSLHLPAPVRDNARAVYGLLADAESKAHGCTVEQIHFHEVGTLDAVADVAVYAPHFKQPPRRLREAMGCKCQIYRSKGRICKIGDARALRVDFRRLRPPAFLYRAEG